MQLMHVVNLNLVAAVLVGMPGCGVRAWLPGHPGSPSPEQPLGRVAALFQANRQPLYRTIPKRPDSPVHCGADKVKVLR